MIRITTDGGRIRFTPEYVASRGGPISGIPARAPTIPTQVHIEWGLYWVRGQARGDAQSASYAHNQTMTAMHVLALESLA